MRSSAAPDGGPRSCLCVAPCGSVSRLSAQRILASGGVALLVLIVLAIVFHGDDSGSNAPTATIPTAPAGVLRAHVAAGQLTLDGPVKASDEKTTIQSAASDRFGSDNVFFLNDTAAT